MYFHTVPVKKNRCILFMYFSLNHIFINELLFILIVQSWYRQRAKYTNDNSNRDSKQPDKNIVNNRRLACCEYGSISA